jgi:predicted neutral ceramidase superfamily lipid hydrolase
LNSLLQQRSGSQEKGRLMATNNFLNMVGVLVASCMLWLMHDAFRIGPLDILLFLAIATLILTFCALKWLPDYAASVAGWMPMFAPVEENQTGLE